MGGFGDLGETEDGGKSSCEKLRAALAVLLVVAVCQNTPLEININANVPKTGISDLRPPFGRPPFPSATLIKVRQEPQDYLVNRLVSPKSEVGTSSRSDNS